MRLVPYVARRLYQSVQSRAQDLKEALYLIKHRECMRQVEYWVVVARTFGAYPV